MPRLTPALLAALAATPTLAADDFSFVVNQGASAVSSTTTITAASDGTLIGDYDATTNPDGTQTRPGLFGGSGNNAIPVSIDFDYTAIVDTAPSGAFSLSVDTDALTFTIDALALDLLSADTADAALDATLLWDLFHTVNPTAVFLGGIPITIPLSTSQITTLGVAQSAPMDAPGVLVEADPGVYTLAGVVPATITLAADSATLPIPETTFDAPLPITGTLTINPDNSASLEITLDLANAAQEIDLTGAPPIENVPFDLPNIAGGDPASVLLTLQFSTASVETMGGVTIIANAEAAGCSPADLAEPFDVLDFSDVIAFLTAFGTMDNAADLAPPAGVYDFSDVVAFLTAFGGGCP
ncbi:MAG: GC-type dockerin domain-anchored protein [Phycisphaerales bacterium]